MTTEQGQIHFADVTLTFPGDDGAPHTIVYVIDSAGYCSVALDGQQVKTPDVNRVRSFFCAANELRA